MDGERDAGEHAGEEDLRSKWEAERSKWTLQQLEAEGSTGGGGKSQGTVGGIGGSSGVDGDTRDLPYSKAGPRVPLGARARAVVPVPTYLSALHGLRVLGVSCGGRHTACVLATGEWLSWGENTCGQLGLGNRSTGSDRPRLVADRCPEGSPFLQVSSGWAHTVARSASGAVFSCGLNAKGQLGTGDCMSRHLPVRLAVQESALDEVGGGGTAAGATRVPGGGEVGLPPGSRADGSVVGMGAVTGSGLDAAPRGRMALLWRRGLAFRRAEPSVVAAIAGAARLRLRVSEGKEDVG